MKSQMYLKGKNELGKAGIVCGGFFTRKKSLLLPHAKKLS